MATERCVSSRIKILQQFMAYALIGVVTNAVGYSVYLLATHFWGAPKLTMSALYIIGAYSGFVANRNFTFCHNGNIGVTGGRYILVQALGYLINLSLLLVFVDLLEFSHQIVQAIAIVVVAIFLFIAMRFYVFTPNPAISKVVN